MPGIYRNDGAPWRRPDGTLIERGAEFVPTDEERLRKAYKLTYLRPPSEPEGLEDYATGNGWYLIDGESVRGREAAAARLAALEADDGED